MPSPKLILTAGLILAALLVAFSLFVNRGIERASFDDAVYDVRFTADGRLAIATDDGIWVAGADLGGLELAIAYPTKSGARSWISPDGAFAAIDEDGGALGLWHIPSRRRLFQTPPRADFSLTDGGWSADNRYFAAATWQWQRQERAVEIWDVASGRLARTLPRDGGGLTWHPTKPILVLPAGGLALIDAPSGRKLGGLEAYGSVFAWSPDGKWLAADKTLWRFQGGGLVKAGWLDGPQDEIASLRFSPDSRLLVAGVGINRSVSGPNETNVYVWRVADQGLIKTFGRHDWIVGSIAISPDNQTVVTGDERGELYVWHP